MSYIRKIVLCLLFIVPVAACAGTPINVKLHVVDDDGKPVADAKVGMGFLLSHGGNSFRGVTNPGGYVEASDRAAFGVKIRIYREGYYESNIRTGYGDQDLTLVFREERNPIAMYAKRTAIRPPVMGVEFGYDLMKGDYVSPYGKGVISDIVFTTLSDQKDAWNFAYHISVRFSNPHDGLYPFYVDNPESKYRSDYLAPASDYRGEWDFRRISVKGRPDETNLDRNRNYYFRVRTTVDDEGKIESAHYGKIYGDFPSIVHYFNPTPNDRNVEFDLERNLLTNLKSGERVLEP